MQVVAKQSKKQVGAEGCCVRGLKNMPSKFGFQGTIVIFRLLLGLYGVALRFSFFMTISLAY